MVEMPQSAVHETGSEITPPNSDIEHCRECTARRSDHRAVPHSLGECHRRGESLANHWNNIGSVDDEMLCIPHSQGHMSDGTTFTGIDRIPGPHPTQQFVDSALSRSCNECLEDVRIDSLTREVDDQFVDRNDERSSSIRILREQFTEMSRLSEGEGPRPAESRSDGRHGWFPDIDSSAHESSTRKTLVHRPRSWEGGTSR